MSETVARVSIYISDGLKARMDAVGEAVNWSEIARPAFLSAVASHEHRRTQTMTTAIERLRASKEKHLDEMTEFGRERGQRWARDHAEWAELKRVADLRTDHPDLISDLRNAIDPGEDLDESDFLKAIDSSEEEANEDAFVEGFIDGAKDFFDAIKPEL
jgi:hypothetical protein